MSTVLESFVPTEGGFCRSCGKPVSKDDQFCAKCGAPINSVAGSSDSGIGDKLAVGAFLVAALAAFLLIVRWGTLYSAYGKADWDGPTPNGFPGFEIFGSVLLLGAFIGFAAIWNHQSSEVAPSPSQERDVWKLLALLIAGGAAAFAIGWFIDAHFVNKNDETAKAWDVAYSVFEGLSWAVLMGAAALLAASFSSDDNQTSVPRLRPAIAVASFGIGLKAFAYVCWMVQQQKSWGSIGMYIAGWFLAYCVIAVALAFAASASAQRTRRERHRTMGVASYIIGGSLILVAVCDLIYATSPDIGDLWVASRKWNAVAYFVFAISAFIMGNALSKGVRELERSPVQR